MEKTDRNSITESVTEHLTQSDTSVQWKDEAQAADKRTQLVREARYFVRKSGSLSGSMQRLSGEDASNYVIEFLDISRNGAKILSPVCAPFGERIRISLKVESESQAIQLAAEVRWLRETADHQWQIGCSLLSALEDELLQQWSAEGILERRRAQRRPADFSVRLICELNPEPLDADVVNISTDGICIRCGASASPESRVRILVPNEQGEEQVAPAEIRWCTEDSGEFLIGCKLVNSENFALLESAAQRAKIASHEDVRSESHVWTHTLSKATLVGVAALVMALPMVAFVSRKAAFLRSDATNGRQPSDMHNACSIDPANSLQLRAVADRAPQPIPAAPASVPSPPASVPVASVPANSKPASVPATPELDASGNDDVAAIEAAPLTSNGASFAELPGDGSKSQIGFSKNAVAPHDLNASSKVTTEVKPALPAAIQEALTAGLSNNSVVEVSPRVDPITDTIHQLGEHFESGLRLLQSGDYNQAQKQLLRATKQRAQSSEVWYALAIAQHAAGREPVARRTLKLAFAKEKENGAMDQRLLPSAPRISLQWMKEQRANQQ